MRGHIVEIATTGNLGLQSPRQGLAITDSLQVRGTRRLGIAYLYIQYLAYSSATDDILYL